MTLLHSEKELLQQGDKAPEFILQNTADDSTTGLEDFSGKALLLIFMCNHCPYVQPKFSEIAALQKEYLENVTVICISSNDIEEVPEDGPEEMKKIAQQFGFQYYLYDEDQSVARAYGAVCTPDPFLFDAHHKLFFHGRLNDAMNPHDVPKKRVMKEMIDAMLAGKKIEKWFEPSMGCSIKWKVEG